MRKRVKLPLIGSILVLIIAVLIAIVMVFPVLVEKPIENKLSELSGANINISTPRLDFNFDTGNFTLYINNLEVATTAQQMSIATINDLAWDINLSSLFEGIYHSSKISINTLTLYSRPAEFNTEKVNKLVTLLDVKEFDFLESLSINATIVMGVKGEKKFEIAPILLTHDRLKISKQNLSFDSSDTESIWVNIDIILPNILDKNAPLVVPILMSNDELSVHSEITLTNKKDDYWLEFKSDLEKIQSNRLVKYLPSQLVDKDTYAWIKRGFIAGTLQKLKLRMKKNLSKPTVIETQFNAQLKNMELLFDPDWKPLKKLNASLNTNGKKIVVMVHNAKLNELPLNDIKVQIADLNQTQLELEVSGGIHAQSEQLIAFLKRAPLNKTMDKTLRQFDLSGKIDGTMQLVIPLDERKSIVDIDLELKDNHLSVLDGAVKVKNYNSKLRFHDNKITATGVGNIRGLPFDIHINPNKKGYKNENTFGVELVNNSKGFEAYISKQFDQSWRVKIESESIKGNAAIFLNENDIPNVRLLDMQVTTLDAIKGDWKITPQDLPDMHLSTHEVYINEEMLPNLSVELTSTDKLLRITDLQFEALKVGDKVLNFNGVWGEGVTMLSANAKGKGLAEFLQALKVKEKITGGEFDFDVLFSCQCAPWNMNYQDITGDLTLKIKKGVFTDKDPHLGRILSLLNINSIAERLKLDVSDVTNKGFTYKTIEAKIHLKDAVATIEAFNLDSSSSQITLTGKGNIVKKEYDLVATIIPAVSDAVPVATYLAGGGLIGLGAWLTDKILFNGKIIDSIADSVVEFKYKITGPWDKPKVEKL
ncbi:FIG005080: Possible exported protein [hydrothermal vent metagenome]|uniref:FIG005080: Possible exported protein n=1 Tax=hydrothermal vent metagenome TaxID=652676 RepID=A0A1W1E6Z5_9ZZZZ